MGQILYHYTDFVSLNGILNDKELRVNNVLNMNDAKEMELSVVELKATEDGYALYRAVGFEDDQSGYRLMKWKKQ